MIDNMDQLYKVCPMYLRFNMTFVPNVFTIQYDICFGEYAYFRT